MSPYRARAVLAVLSLACLVVFLVLALAARASADVFARAETALGHALDARRAAERCEYHAGAGVQDAAGTPHSADMVKAQSECRLLKNDAARASYALQKVIDRKPPPTPAPDPAPPPSTGPDPAPPPPPVGPVPPPDGIAIDGRGAGVVPLGSITTPSGFYPVHDLGAVNGGRAYAIADTSGAFDVCIARLPAAAMKIDDRPYRVGIAGAVTPLTVLPGSFKCLGRELPSAAPSPERLRAAVVAGRVSPYSRAAFAGWPRTPVLALEPLQGAAVYRPDRIYWRGSSYDKTFGNVSGSAGEANSSRGFIAGDDAVLVASAGGGDAGAFAKAAARARVQMLYGLALPYLAVWSANHHALRDPQLPLAGDRPYRNEGGDWASGDNYGDEGSWCAPAGYPYLAEIEATAGTCYSHARDQAHQFNHGYAYWLATGDPRAALLLQATAAYALAANYQRHDGRYRIRFSYQRTTLNQFSAMWKLRDVAINASGPLLWSRARADAMVADIVADWSAQLARLDARTDAVGLMHRAAGSFDVTEHYSDFMGQAYGAEPAYLFASIGKGALLARLAANMVWRAKDVGGTRGLDKTTGSAIVTIDGSATTREAVIARVMARTDEPTASFDGAQAHYVLRAYWLLRMAKDAAARGWIAPVAGIDEAIAKMEAARDRTTAWKYLDTVAWKHAGVTF